MLGSASRKNRTARKRRVLFGRRGCPTLSHLPAPGGTAKRYADWAFVSGVSGVSGVSPVSPNLKLIQKWRIETAAEGLIAAAPPPLGQVRQVQR